MESVLTARERQVFQIIKRAGSAGVAGKDIFDILYQDDPDGGPDQINVISIFVGNIRRKLAPYGLRVNINHGGRGALYFLKKEIRKRSHEQ